MLYEESFRDAYREVNRTFAKAIAAEFKDGETIWVHDFHLMLVPRMLREELGDLGADIKIGFFLHTPFPDVDFYKIIPDCHNILDSLLHCDLVGFHIDSYGEHFRNACNRLM